MKEEEESDLVEVVGDGLVGPADGALEGVHHRHVHDRADVRQVPGICLKGLFDRF